MKNLYHTISPLLVCAVAAILLSPVPAFLAAAAADRQSRVGYLCLTVSLLIFGIGEVLNHPAHSGNRYTKDTEAGRFYRFHQRKRIPGAPGNLLFIISILIFFVGLGKLFAS